ncbi:MAG: hypothetical protein R3E58_04885 [Phycisphaerae bacterium]
MNRPVSPQSSWQLAAHPQQAVTGGTGDRSAELRLTISDGRHAGEFGKFAIIG